MLYLPISMTFFTKKADVSISEQRKLAVMPKLEMNLESFASFSEGFEKYFKDHFAFRSAIIHAHNHIKVFWLKKSPVSSVLLGTDGWLFEQSEKSMEDYRGLDPFTPGELLRWGKILSVRKQWLNKQGIQYLFVVAPNKHTIYPEYLPHYLSASSKWTRMDQLSGYLRAESDIDLIDLRGSLMKAKPSGILYYKTDSHWNSMGGFLAYENIVNHMTKWFPGEKVLDDSLLAIVKDSNSGGDLAEMLGIGNVFRDYEYPYKYVRTPQAQKTIFDYSPNSFRTISTRACLSAVICRDSFFSAVEPFLSEHFNQAYYLWKLGSHSNYDHRVLKNIISRIKPQLVIEEISERFLKQVPDLDLEELFDLSGVTSLNMNPDAGFEGIKPVNQISIRYSSDGLVLSSTGDDPYVILPPLKTEPVGPSIVRMVLTSPGDSFVQLFYRTPSFPYYYERQSVYQIIKKGNNEIYLDLPEKDVIGNLRLDPGHLAGDYILHSIEIRNNPVCESMPGADQRMKDLFDLSTDTLLDLNPKKGFGGIEPRNQAPLFLSAEGLVLRSEGNDPYVSLPLVQMEPRSSSIVKISLSCPDDTIARIYYQTQPFYYSFVRRFYDLALPYDDKKTVSHFVKKGFNEFYLELPEGLITGNLRFDPGQIAGDYILQSIEIRKKPL